MLGAIYNDVTRDTWTNTPNHSIVNTYDSNGNIITSTYKDGDNVLFIKTFTWENGNCTQIQCSVPSNN